jgi:hexosaminidase
VRSLLILVFLLAHCAHAEPLRLIPMPQHVETPKEGKKNVYYELSANDKFIYNTKDSFYANELNQAIYDKYKFKLKRRSRGSKNKIKFYLYDSEKKWKKAALEYHFNSMFLADDESYVLHINKHSIQIFARAKAGLFYGVQTLKQIIQANTEGHKLPIIEIHDRPDFKIRAWQDDISRGPIPNMEFLKKEIRTMAAFKLNHFTLYTESVFKLSAYPNIAPADGISAKDIAELTAYAKRYHVELIGNYQAFGHMEKTLAYPALKHLAENGHIITPTKAESYAFLSSAFADIAPSYSSKYFNINCDETFGLGEEQSKPMLNKLGIEGLYTYHINKLDSLLKPYHKRVLMWADIVGNHPKITNLLPQDITLIVWAYHGATDFEEQIKPIAASGLNFWVAPGVSCWGNVFPNLAEARTNIFNLIRDGKKYQATGVLNTTWDDDGLNLFENNWLPLAWGAELSWHAPNTEYDLKMSSSECNVRYQSFCSTFDYLFFSSRSTNKAGLMVSLSELHQFKIRDLLKNKRFFDPIFPIYADDTKDRYKSELQDLDNEIDYIKTLLRADSGIETKNLGNIESLLLASKMASFTLRKNLVQLQVYECSQNRLAPKDVPRLKTDLLALSEECTSLKNEYVRLWNNENKPYWLEQNTTQFDALSSSLSSAPTNCLLFPSAQITERGRSFTLKTLIDSAPIFYSINNETPKPYSSAFDVKTDFKLQAGTMQNNRFVPTVQDSFIYHLGIGKTTQLLSNYSFYHPSYDGGGIMGLCDGRIGSADNLRSGRWQGYSGQNIDLEMDLQKAETLHSFSMGFFQNTLSWVIFPKEILIYYKLKAEQPYQLYKTIQNTIGPDTKGNIKKDFYLDLENLNTRYIKIVAVNYGNLPIWHPAGNKYQSMLFSDEIILK